MITSRFAFRIFGAVGALSLALVPARAQDPEQVPPPQVDQNQYKDYSHIRVVRLSLADGDVQVARPEESGWQRAIINTPIRQGYAIATNRGRAEIEFESGATARLAEDSMLEFTELALGDGNRITRVTLSRGTATFYARLANKDVFQVFTRKLTFTVPDDARFRVDVGNAGASASVFKGELLADSPSQSTRVAKGQTIQIRDTDADRFTLARNAEPDAWDHWVSDRDERIPAYTPANSGYYNAPFSYGVNDLSYYGTWTNMPGYGYVWQPNSIYAGWAPYYDGRWTYVFGVGWTWVSAEPWGWVPYHYGRWAYGRNHWFWVPGSYYTWNPGLVVWLSFGNHIGWCPLGPHDRWGGRATFQNINHITIINTSVGAIRGSGNVVTTGFSGRNRPTPTIQPPLNRADFESRGGRELRTADGNNSFSRSGGTVNAPATRANGFVDNRAAPQTGRGVSGTAGAPVPRPSIEYDPATRRYVNSNNPPGYENRGGPATNSATVGGRRESDGPAPAVNPRYVPPPQGAPNSSAPAANSGSYGNRGTPTYAPPQRDARPMPAPAPSYTPPRESRPSPAPAPPQSSGGFGGRPNPSPAPAPAPAPAPRAEPPRPNPAPQKPNNPPTGGYGYMSRQSPSSSGSTGHASAPSSSHSSSHSAPSSSRGESRSSGQGSSRRP
ncbi:MAG: FecR domain-containing protein [Acidobacteria bacterium]|nr:FecR domain-containing protein [Acidobacteriota bacterium]